MRSVVAYVRISKDREGQQVGIDRQEQDCRLLAEQLGVTVARVFADNDLSASTLSRKKRPAYEEMMSLVEVGQVDAIVAYSNSRLTRRPLELERLITAHDRTRVQFHTVVSGQDDLSTADGRMVARIKASVDAAESERMGERIRRAQQESRAQGRWHGGIRPYGFTINKEGGGLTPDTDEAVNIVQASKALIQGRSMLGIVRDLNERGALTSMGKPWSVRTLQRVLRRSHPLVDDETREMVAAILDDPARRTTPGPRRRWLLSGIARCVHCDAPLRGSASSKGVGKGTYPAYRCMEGKHLVISALALDEYISTVAVARLALPDLQKLMKPAPKGHGADTTRLAAEERDLRARLDRLADDITMPERVLERRVAALQQRLDEIGAIRTAMARVSPLHVFHGRDPQKVWNDLDLDRRQLAVKTLMTVTVSGGSRGIVPRVHRWRLDLPAFDPRRVTVVWPDDVAGD